MDAEESAVGHNKTSEPLQTNANARKRSERSCGAKVPGAVQSCTRPIRRTRRLLRPRLQFQGPNKRRSFRRSICELKLLFTTDGRPTATSFWCSSDGTTFKQAVILAWSVLSALALSVPTLLHCMHFCSSPTPLPFKCRQDLHRRRRASETGRRD